jgi:CRISPR-associated endonuclease/helicase Cas3
MSLPSNLYSHPGRLLEKHLISVAEGCKKVIVNTEIGKWDKEQLANLAYLTGLTHDLGKATIYFQEHLKRNDKGSVYTKHALLSSVLLLYILKDAQVDPLLKMISFISVKSHHTDLGDFKQELNIDGSDKEILIEQINKINKTQFELLLKNTKINEYLQRNFNTSFIFDKDRLKKFIEQDIDSILGDLVETIDYQDSTSYLLTNTFFSALLSSDKIDAAVKKQVNAKPFEIKQETIRKYKETLPHESDISTIREQVFQDAEKNFSLLVSQQPIPRVFFVTLPTGLGKTLIGFNLANILRNKILTKQSIPYRIIYALPFINIIDQNAQTIEKILKMQFGEVNTDLLLKNHHLSEISYKTEEKSYDTGVADILIETWQSNIIVTTFVQLFHTLISNKNSMLMKFNKLSHSIIILDEVQAIPLQYWRIIDKLLHEALEKLDSYAIIMTATKPILFSDGENVVQAPKIDSRYILDADTYFGITSMEEFLEKFEINHDKSYMFVLNTINEAKKFYELLSYYVPKEKLTFLSSHIVPKERIKRVNEIRQHKYKFLVTTQVVEAGVDIDFDVVVRDFAPLDSIVQSSGRCNRNFVKEQGIVYVTKLRDENHFYSSYIYDKVLLEITEKLIKGRKFNEEKLYEVFGEYEKEVLNRKDTVGKSKIIEESIIKLKYDGKDGLSEFSIIEKTYPVIDVFVEVDEEAEKKFKEFGEIRSIQNKFERHSKFKEIKKDFYSYVISVPATVQNLPPIVNDFYYVSMSSLNKHYDKNTGYIAEGKDPIFG